MQKDIEKMEAFIWKMDSVQIIRWEVKNSRVFREFEKWGNTSPLFSWI